LCGNRADVTTETGNNHGHVLVAINDDSGSDSRLADAWPYVIIAGASLIFASNHIIARYLEGVIPPMGFVFWRMVIGAAVLMPFAAPGLIGHRRLIIKHWKLFALMGLLFVPLGNGGIYAAYTFTTALNGGVVSAAQPVITVLLSALLFRDLINGKQGIGILIAATGVLAIIARGDPATILALEFNIGDLMMLGATGAVALHNVLVRKVPREINIPQLLVIIQLFGLVVATPLYIIETIYVRPVPFTGQSVIALLWVGMVVTAVAVGLTNAAIRKLGANKASISNYMRVLFTAVLAILLLGETFEGFHLFGLVAVVGGVYLMTRGRSVPVK
jgi:drug/metabolite transporter (DMT)-like permease